MLIDALDRPDLRSRAMARLSRFIRSPLAPLEGRLELALGLASVVYVAVMCAVTIVLHRLLLEDSVGGLLSREFAVAGGWTFAVANVVLAAAAVLGEVRRSPSQP